MLDVYRLLASRAGTPDALELAHDLTSWHDAMVRHERTQAALGAVCTTAEECPHSDAPDLWRRARQVFGAGADELAFLRAAAGQATSLADADAR